MVPSQKVAIFVKLRGLTGAPRWGGSAVQARPYLFESNPVSKFDGEKRMTTLNSAFELNPCCVSEFAVTTPRATVAEEEEEGGDRLDDLFPHLPVKDRQKARAKSSRNRLLRLADNV